MQMYVISAEKPLPLHRKMKKMQTQRLIHTAVLLFLVLTCQASESVKPDSVWYDSITGMRTHLQRIDTIMPHTCALHFFGKKPDGTAKLPGLQALIEDVSINGLVLSYDYFVQDRVWARVSRHVIEDNLTGGWVWDNDSFSGNQFAHPFHGSMFYNAARQHGLSYGVSLLYPVAGSLTWELFCETNRPAYNDLLSTGIGGSAFGEVTHRISDIFFDDSKRGGGRVVREIIGTLLNPVRGVHRMMSGEMFRVNRLNAGKKEAPMPYTFQIGVGDRYIYDLGPVHPRIGERYYKHVPFIDFRFNYGDHFNHIDDDKPARAYDYFTFYALVNLASRQPTVGELDICGRIGSIQQEHSHGWKLDLGLYQNVKYVDHYAKRGEDPGNLAMISEAVSFGGGLYAQHEGKRTTLSHSLMLSAVPLGGSAADYYPFRRYNYGTGASLRYRFEYTLNRHLTVGDDFYFMRLFIIKGETPQKLAIYTSNEHRYWKEVEDGIDAWGDKGEHSILQNRAFVHFNLCPGLQLRLQHEFHLRHGNYRYYPSITGKNHEFYMGINYAL